MVNVFFAKGSRRNSQDDPLDISTPIFLDNSHRVIEAPSLWAIKLASKYSRSKATLHTYSQLMQRYLRWLEDSGYGAHQWMAVDQEIFEEYIEFLCQSKIIAETATYYCARIASFYKWATSNGYENYFSWDVEECDALVKINLKDQLLLGHVKSHVEVEKLPFTTPIGRPALHEKEVEKFVTERNHRAALFLLDDVVYKIIATIIRITGLRPRDLFQIPYRGNKENFGFVPYDIDEIPSDLKRKDIRFYFRSKGKNRSIEFPGALWELICRVYIPLRRERAEIHYEKNGVSPRNNQLFLSSDGVVVTPYMLRYNFAKVVPVDRMEDGAEQKDSRHAVVFHGRKYTPRMLRHSCATYFVYERLKKEGRVGKEYVYDPVIDEDLRKMLGHEDVGTTYKYYVHLVNRFHHDDLLADLKKSHVNQGFNALLDAIDY